MKRVPAYRQAGNAECGDLIKELRCKSQNLTLAGSVKLGDFFQIFKKIILTISSRKREA